MPKPYAQLRAQMTPDAQRQAEAQAQALLAADTAQVQGQDLPAGAVPIVRWPIQCPFCRCTAPLTAYDLQEGGIYTCSGCHTLLRAALWRTDAPGFGHLRWTIPLQDVLGGGA